MASFDKNAYLSPTSSPSFSSSNNNNLKIRKLRKPPATNVKYPCPKYWCSSGSAGSTPKDYFILASGGEDSLGVLAYDFDTDKWLTWCDYPENVNPECAIATIDHENDLLFLSHGLEPLLAILDLETKEWEVFMTVENDTYNPVRDKKMVKGQGRGRILPNGEFHVLVTSNMQNQHLKYNMEEEKFELVSQLATENNCDLQSHAICYIVEKNYLLQLGSI